MRAHMEHLPERPPRRRLVRIRTRTCAPGIGDLARQIEIEHKAAVDAWDNVMERVIACGRLLLQAKARVGHGLWLSWVEEHLTLGIRQVQNYMRVAEHASALPNAQCDAHLTIDGVLALIAAQRRKTPRAPPTASDPAVPARAPATTNARATPAAPAPRAPTRQAAPDHFVQLQNALGVFAALPKPDVLAHVVARRRVDTADMLRQLTNTSQYITSFARELNARRR
jgi:hypothetical protein